MVCEHKQTFFPRVPNREGEDILVRKCVDCGEIIERSDRHLGVKRRHCSVCRRKIDVLEDVYYKRNNDYYCKRHFKPFIKAVEKE